MADNNNNQNFSQKFKLIKWSFLGFCLISSLVAIILAILTRQLVLDNIPYEDRYDPDQADNGCDPRIRLCYEPVWSGKFYIIAALYTALYAVGIVCSIKHHYLLTIAFVILAKIGVGFNILMSVQQFAHFLWANTVLNLITLLFGYAFLFQVRALRIATLRQTNIVYANATAFPPNIYPGQFVATPSNQYFSNELSTNNYPVNIESKAVQQDDSQQYSKPPPY